MTSQQPRTGSSGRLPWMIGKNWDFLHQWYIKRACWLIVKSKHSVEHLDQILWLGNKADCLCLCKKSAVQEILISIIRLWDPDVKIFGSGTELRVSKKRSSPPKNSEILQKKHANQIMYVCFIEKFYPEVIRVTWTEDEKEVTDNVVKGDTWKSTKEDEYTIASWLTVPAESEDKKYYCKYEHEEESTSLPTQVASVKTSPQEEDCRTIFNRDQLMHKTAYLVYIILLLKSSVYNIIILFFIYRMWALTKHQGKKA
ncbi:uncharacterized protein LOC103823810 isoform X1 [Serinus canaria]|uniref:uncharacterized protein LOC103823810 isoform X1 n=1 Tax=Serinus canaria TaxID=9135 RepID=UPI0021CC901E|nr:uncharacterized protein LOC103823810 isoform X1 [Serinus canaria]